MLRSENELNKPSFSRLRSGSSSASTDSTSLSKRKETMEDELLEFMAKRQKKLKITPNPGENSKESIDYKTLRDEGEEEMAKMYYLKAKKWEKAGRMSEAFKCYKIAFESVPDIDYRLRFLKREEDPMHILTTKMIKNRDLLQKFRNKISGAMCSPDQEQNTTHISVLPVELIFYILKFVVSEELDLKSLEMFSQVCRGYYLCARESEMWKLACIKIWGPNCTAEKYVNWRQMFLDRARLQFNGCYISKTTYIRRGQNGFQDEFYRPWHLITYYRYFRFFPEGTVFLLSTSDEPKKCLPLLENQTCNPPFHSGFYTLEDDIVRITVHRFYERNTRRGVNVSSPQTYKIELKITNHRNKKHIKLQWSHYSIRTRCRREESVCVFDLVNSKYPPLWFSEVKSYTIEPEVSLN